ncbi:VCBS domain-containing protein, partial [Pseudomaricurvus sp. HS19]|uniref:VCBS domain-containing protein n=1 Tax=Pseudomaricurvus sp. HS19 TaxID=2692626 RepID=UPI001370F903
DGHYTFDPSNAAYQNLAAGEPYDVVIPITVTDATGANTTRSDAITIHLTGTNDAPVVNHVVTSQVATEDAAFSFALPADTFGDIDTGDSLTLSAT